MKPAKINQVTVTIKNQRAEFRANGKTILFPGYMAAYVESTDSQEVVTKRTKKLFYLNWKKKQTLLCSFPRVQ